MRVAHRASCFRAGKRIVQGRPGRSSSVPHETTYCGGKAAIVLHAEGGRLPSSARSKRKRAGSDVKGSAAPGLRPPLTSPPPQTAKTSARSTGNDIEPSLRLG